MSKYLISLICLTLTACAPPSEDLNDIKKTHSKPQMGFSGLVIIQHSELDTASPQLPPQISVDFEKQTSAGRHLMLYKSPVRLQLISTSSDFVSLGCNESTDIEQMPDFINVDTLKICDRHQITHNNLNIVANRVILDNAKLEFIPTQSKQGHNRIEIVARTFWLEGQNKITLIGSKLHDGRSLPPTLSLDAGTLTGAGHLKVLSKANIFSVSIK
ncbi:hypothetical protein Bb109J_c2029 [Bdellovibrio bacteriovorus]|uniref:hypothetical protein n=1 Tax=Bdellovibrio bacteriovorus TaxID=959 RepID=UPI00045C0223|nr:hypothetical protein [Bdellovibrio bacteriovorus]AHZ84721.1 hypothetical protein EP01_07190 [Bdellovibrio bacteriovorus]BEV68609.1 hypothetical protein Bb109J_c2029 [Bdellovibrio bacteriovorus]